MQKEVTVILNIEHGLFEKLCFPANLMAKLVVILILNLIISPQI